MVYKTTPTEKQKARRIVSALTPGKRVHGQYVEAAELFLGIADLVPFIGHRSGRVRLEGFRWHLSVLFRREYLIAHVDNHVLGVIAPECDAIATMTSTIPLILVPASRRWSKSERFQAILEHEVVHVNQVLLGVGLGAGSSASSTVEAVDAFFWRTRTEYEANLIQLTAWPRALPSKYGLSLEQWCALRGWTAALEAVARGDFCLRRVMGPLLTGVEEEAPTRLRAMGMPSSVVAWLLERQVRLLRSALLLELKRAPSLERSTSFLAAVEWLRRRLQKP